MPWFNVFLLKDSMGPTKRAVLYATVVTLAVAVLFKICFWLDDSLLPVYQWLAWPGITWAGFFSAELDYWPKFIIVLVGQFLFCFVVLITVNWAWRFIKQALCARRGPYPSPIKQRMCANAARPKASKS
ncbi:hypothetical protein [Halioxenophilus aromaticivorans]|uniref:Uncharacterized protein n=1 Tax=Halioxenophilus aromaticivorans TaxID=1306992 RepID=A0AAV3TZB5_9ALTE